MLSDDLFFTSRYKAVYASRLDGCETNINGQTDFDVCVLLYFTVLLINNLINRTAHTIYEHYCTNQPLCRQNLLILGGIVRRRCFLRSRIVQVGTALYHLAFGYHHVRHGADADAVRF